MCGGDEVVTCINVQLLSVQESDGLEEETVSQSGSEGPNALVPLARRQQCEECV